MTASRARCCSRTPTRSPAARRRRSARGSPRPTSRIPSSRSPGARAHNRFLAELCAHSPERRAGVALVPITHDVDRAVTEIEWAAANGLRGGILVPTMWHDHAPYLDPVYEPVWAACAAADLPVHTHSGSAPMDEYQENVGVYLAEVVWWAVRPDVVPALRRRVRAAPEPEVLHHRVRGVLGARPHVEVGHLPGRRPHHEEAGGPARGQGEPSPERLLRPERVHRCIHDEPRGDPAPVRDRYRHGHVGQRLPASRRHVAAHRRQAARRRSTTSPWPTPS